MIEKRVAESLGIEIIDSSSTMTDAKKELINKVKELLPNIVNSDNIVDTNALNDLFNINEYNGE